MLDEARIIAHNKKFNLGPDTNDLLFYSDRNRNFDLSSLDEDEEIENESDDTESGLLATATHETSTKTDQPK